VQMIGSCFGTCHTAGRLMARFFAGLNSLEMLVAAPFDPCLPWVALELRRRQMGREAVTRRTILLAEQLRYSGAKL
jgi:hypothetical protein